MDLRNLQAFIAVAECASFSQAAERLHISQPAVSKRITLLEEEIATPLFDRIGRKVSLTEAGMALLPNARKILETVEDTRRTLSNLSGRVEGRLSLGTSHHIGLHHLPPVLRAFTARYPNVQLDIRFLDSEAACHGIEVGELEIAVVTLPADPPPSLQAETVWEDPLAVVAGREHPLAGRNQVHPRELESYSAILPAFGTFTREVVEEVFRPHGLVPSVTLSTNYLETIKMLVSVGLGWSVLPLTMIDADIVSLPVSGVALMRRLGIVTHRSRTLSNAAHAFWALILEKGAATNRP